MTQAVAYRDSQSGQEEASSGLIIHRGPLSAATFRAMGSPATGQFVPPRDGQGSGSSLELHHVPKQYGLIASYDRDVGQWLDLQINAKNIALQSNSGGKVTLPAGSAQQLWYYYAQTNWANPQVNVWTETPIQANVSGAVGGVWRIEFNCQVVGPTPGTAVYLGVGIDGTVTWPFISVQNIMVNAYCHNVSGFMYHATAPAGAHRVSVYLQANGAGVSLTPAGYAALWVTEQRA